MTSQPSILRKPSMRSSMLPPPTNPRQSLAQRQSLAMAPGRTAGTSRASDPRSSIRKSTLPMSSMNVANVSRIYQQAPPSARKAPRQSSFGVGYGATTMANRDPRPTRNAEYLGNMMNEIHEYLASSGFEIEMRHPLTNKTLRQPTQKDFVMMFQFLYKRLDPGYRFTKSIEQEVYTLLRAIHYPYIDSINKSAISAVGGANSWPTFVGMLFWLVQLNQTLEKYDTKDFESTQEDEDEEVDLIFMRYISKSYRAYLALEDDYSEYKAEAEHEFDQYSAKLIDTVKTVEEDNEIMKRKGEELSKDAEKLAALEERGAALKSDVVKFQVYIQKMEDQKPKRQAKMDIVLASLRNYEEELRELENEKETLRAQIQAQGLSPGDIDRMNTERDQLSKELNTVGERLQSIERIVKDKELSCRRNLDSLERTLQDYSNKLYEVGLSTSSDYDFTIQLHDPMSNDQLGKRPEELLGHKDLRGSVRPTLQQYRNHIHDRILKAQDEVLRLSELADRALEIVNELRDQKDTLEAQLNTAKMTYAELYDMIQSDASASNADVEKLERQIQQMKANSGQGLFHLTQRAQSVKIEYDEVKVAVEEARMRMNADVEKLISNVINFKLHIQSSLEDYENFVLDEFERSNN